MIFTTKMVFLGIEPKESKKSGNQYLMAKFMETEGSSIFEFYVPSDRLKLVTDLGQTDRFSEVGVKLKVSSFNSKAQVDLEGVEEK
jgi:hypothetical protein